MKIGLSTTSLEPARNGGVIDGIGTYTRRLRTGLPELGIDVAPYSFPGFLKPSSELVHGIAMPSSFAAMSATTIAGRGAFMRFSPEVDLFHSTDFKVIPANVPVVATVWDAIPLIHPEWTRSRTRAFAPWVLKRLVPFADRVIVGSEHSANDIARHFRIPDNNISVVPWGLSQDWFEPVGAEARDRTLDKYGLSSGYALTVGTIQPRKNIEGLLDAYEQLPAAVRSNHKLVIVGKYGWGSEALKARLFGLSANSDVIWLSKVDTFEEIRAIYAGAGAFIFPSLYEGFGIPLLEAFASGVPVVSSNLSALPEVSAGAALEIDPRNTGELADAMRHLLEDEALRANHIAAGQKRAALFTEEQALKATIAVYEQTLAETGGGRSR